MSLFLQVFIEVKKCKILQFCCSKLKILRGLKKDDKVSGFIIFAPNI